MITILIIICSIFYILGAIFFALLSGVDLSKVTGLLQVIFYPITMWFIK